jgi:hypothetical protein
MTRHRRLVRRPAFAGIVVLTATAALALWPLLSRAAFEARPGPAPAPKPAAAAQETSQTTPAELELVKQIIIPGVSTWTDTGLDVVEGQEYVVRAAGGISLQRGNPTAFCGPDGYNLKTAQQPLPDRNIGALVGRVVLLISVEKDPETKKEFRNERIEVFYVGSESRIMISLKGRFFLGVNENVVGDNSGEFRASIFRVKSM